MTRSPETLTAELLASFEEIDDLVARYEKVRDIEDELEAGLKAVKAAIAKTLHESYVWREVGEMLGVTGSRAEQISRASR